MKRLMTAVALLAASLATHSAQWTNPDVVFPPADPAAFSVITQAELENAILRIERLEGDLANAESDDESRFLMRMILETIQGELNRGTNASSVLAVERASESYPAPRMPLRWQSAYLVLEQRLLKLGPDALKIYREMYEGRAGDLLREAVRLQDRERMLLVNRRFGLTASGAHASILLARADWAEGALSRAARGIERALSTPDLHSDETMVYLNAWLADAYHRLGEQANLQQLHTRVTEAGLAEMKFRAGDDARELGAHVRELVTATRVDPNRSTATDGYITPGGNLTNTGIPRKAGDADQVAWTQPLPSLEAMRQVRQFKSYPSPVVPPHLPVFDGSLIYVNTGDRLLAYDMVDGGSGPVWDSKPFPTLSHHWRTSEPDPSHIMPVTLYRGVVFTALENPLTTAFHNPNPEQRFGLYPHFPKVRRALCAVDSASGRLLWRIGGQYTGSRDDVMSFSTAVVYDGVLYAVATHVEANADIQLYALDPETGEVLWRLRVARGQQETTMFGRPARKPFPSLPALVRGRLFINTNLGGLAAVDLRTRSVDWVRRYDYMPRPDTKYIRMHYRTVTWYNSPAMYAEQDGVGYVVIAPTDANYLFAIDAETGEEVWRVRRDGNLIPGARALVGIRNGRVYVAGDGDGSVPLSRVSVLGLRSGELIASERVVIPGRETQLGLAGRPTIAGDEMLWPGMDSGRSEALVARIDLDSLRTTSVHRAPGTYAREGFSVFSQLGVVYTISGRNYSHGTSQLAARVDISSLLEAVRRELRDAPEDPELNLRLAMLMLRANERTEALVALERAWRHAETPPNPRVRNMAAQALVSEHLRLADIRLTRRDHEAAREHINNARKFAVSRVHLTEIFLRDEHVLRQMDDRGALELFYRGIMESDPDFGVGDNPELPARLYAAVRLGDLLKNSGSHEAAVQVLHGLLMAGSRYFYEGETLRSHALGRLREILREHGAAPFAAVHARAEALVESGTRENLTRAMEAYPLSPAADTALRRLVEENFAAGRHGNSLELIELAMEEHPDRDRAFELEVLMALVRSGMGDELRARLMAGRLLREHGRESMRFGGESRTVQELLEPLAASPDDIGEVQIPPRLPRNLTELWQEGAGPHLRVPIQPVPGPLEAVMTNEVSEDGRMRTLVARDRETGDALWELQAQAFVNELFPIRGGMLATLGNGLMAMDPQGTEIWSKGVGSRPDSVVMYGGMVLFGTRMFDVDSRANVIQVAALDLSNGEDVWRAGMGGAQLRWLQATSRGVLALTQGSSTELSLLALEDGRVLESRDLPIPARLTASPMLVDGRVVMVDREGMLHEFDAVTLKPGVTRNSQMRFPTGLHVDGKSAVVFGRGGAVRINLESGEEAWRFNLQGGTALVNQEVSGDVLVLATRSGMAPGQLQGISLKTGELVFERSFPHRPDGQRVDVLASATFEGGLVMLFADNRIERGQQIRNAYHMLVLDNDGTERFVWQRDVTTNNRFVQFAVADGAILLCCDERVFCFGARR
jgi:outer membrane protein assembly factor BamB/tetratricopeptide (TPR) repeat protein